MIKEFQAPDFYAYLSPYLQIIFTALIGHHFFLKQHVLQKKADRNNQIRLQSEKFHKEIFDQLWSKIENVLVILGSVQGYSSIILNSASQKEFIFKKHLNNFYIESEKLEERMHLISLTLEKYDFLFDEDRSLQEKTSNLYKKLNEIALDIYELNTSQPQQHSQLEEQCNKLYQICSEINLHTVEISKKAKQKIEKILFTYPTDS